MPNLSLKLPSRVLPAAAIAAIPILCTLPTAAESVFLDLGTADGEPGIAPKPSAETVLRPSVPTVTFEYDVSELQLGGTAATLNLVLVSDNGENVRTAGRAGVVVNRGAASNQWDTGEDLTFTLSLIDTDGLDVTETYVVDLTGAEIRWTRNSGVATFNGSEVVAAETAESSADFVKYSFTTEATNETTVKASRVGGSAAQLAGLEFDIALAPEPGSMALFSTGALLLFRRRQPGT